MKIAHDKDLRPFLIYPATLKLRLVTGPKLFDDAASAMDFIHRQPPASGDTDNAPERRGKARRNLFVGESGSAAPESGQMQGGTWPWISDPVSSSFPLSIPLLLPLLPPHVLDERLV